MDQLLVFLQNNFPVIFYHKFLFLFIGAAIEGLNVLVLAGFLVSIGSLKLAPTFAVLTLGYTLNGYLWYLVGYFGGAKPIDKWGRKDPKSRKIIETVEHYFTRYSGRAIVFTKFTFALTITALIMAGSFKYDIRKFTWYNFLGSIGWVIVTMTVGFFFGESYQFLVVYLKNITFFILFLGGGIAIIYLIKIFLKSTLIKSLQLTEKMRVIGDRLREGIDDFLS